MTFSLFCMSVAWILECMCLICLPMETTSLPRHSSHDNTSHLFGEFSQSAEHRTSTSVIQFQGKHLEIELSNGRAYEGVLFVRRGKEVGLVCADNWTVENADVACRQLGFHLGAEKAETVGQPNASMNYFFKNVQCIGSETNLDNCSKQIVKNGICHGGKTAAVKCRTSHKECSSHEFQCSSKQCIRASFLCDGDEDCDNGMDEDFERCTEPLAARLAGGLNNASGRVEIKYRGVWGTICDDSWDDRDAAVICKMLGFRSDESEYLEKQIVAYDGGHFQPGKGLIWLDDIMCTGNEVSIEDCVKRPWGRSNCLHEEDAGVTCLAHTSGSTMTEKPITSVRSCGQRYPVFNFTNLVLLDSSRVVGGYPAMPGSHPWQAGIRITSRHGSRHHCGGTIISEYLVVSAAHCFLKLPMRMYVIRVGDFITDEHDTDEEEFKIDAIFKHEYFRQGGSRMNNDIALLRVLANNKGRGIRFGRNVQPACLPSKTTLYSPGIHCLISGWGKMEFRDHVYPSQLQESEVPILPFSTCRHPEVYGNIKFTENMFCAGYLDGGIDTCKGDSGGPLVCSIQNHFILFGVVSWGDLCGIENKPGVYTRVQNYLDWISEKMNAA